MIALETLRQTFSGDILFPGDASYEQASTIFVGKGAPQTILLPHSAQDVALAIRYTKEQKLTLSVRSGGHGMAGFATNDGGIVIDLTRMNEVKIIDTAKGIVQIGTGATWEKTANALAKHGLIISSGDTRSVGVGGLTLGGGIGWMVRKYGLTIDSLIGAEVVTADGQILQANADEHADLFWAIRGGGGNFGIVTHFLFSARQSSGLVHAGAIIYDFTAMSAVLKTWRDTMQDADENLTSIVRILPPRGPAPGQLLVQICYDGTNDAMQATIAPLLQMAEAQSNNIQERKYVDFLEESIKPPIRVVVKSMFAQTLSDELISTIVGVYQKPGAPILQIRSMGGAVARVAADATAFAFRDSAVMIAGGTAVLTNNIATAMQPWETIAKYAEGAYGNFLSTHDAKDVALVYPATTTQRLATVKQAYDPDNLFSQNFTINPTAQESII